MEDEDIGRLADHFGVTEDEISSMQTRISARDISLSQSPSEDDSSTYADAISDPSQDQERLLGELEFSAVARKSLREAMERLSEREKKVIDERFLLEKPRKLAEIARDLGVSQERVRQIQCGAVEKLRKAMRRTPGLRQ